MPLQIQISLLPCTQKDSKKLDLFTHGVGAHAAALAVKSQDLNLRRKLGIQRRLYRVEGIGKDCIGIAVDDCLHIRLGSTADAWILAHLRKAVGLLCKCVPDAHDPIICSQKLNDLSALMGIDDDPLERLLNSHRLIVRVHNCDLSLGTVDDPLHLGDIRLVYHSIVVCIGQVRLQLFAFDYPLQIHQVLLVYIAIEIGVAEDMQDIVPGVSRNRQAT